MKLSNYREDSEISRLNQQKTTEWLSVSTEIAELADIAKQVYERSHGCYDLTVKPIFDLWGFAKHENRVPTQEEINNALKHVGMSRVEIDKPNARIRKLDPEVQIDLSSIAQGYTVAATAKLLESQGIQNYLVEIGGEMKVKGHNASGNPWRVAIQKPTPFTREVQKILDIHQFNGAAIMTAGTYQNFFQDKGRTYSHILNPQTGSPVTHHLLSVTILHDDPTWEDAWDTALLCVGETEAIKIADTEQLKTLLIYQEGQALKAYMSNAFITAQEKK
ncbi:FAD:protein FMN transferase [Methylobacter sp. YRD-M1]|uniref:FAD:protein FMN transferase n=1 Tax=Methylobacter sp. YRD-M1 TaxID=2911520 RepID=UPI00227C0F95|nr:FAD:protein FMN transferase [Methylobacter sp. YRD-M1]WAK04176.1 FAD:protein FMN transferase [Methylobacter sp. YRD-M1]